MIITKAVIPAAGFGTRMLPAAKAVPKELLPVLHKPTIQYVVEECAQAGITEICLVTSRDKPALLQHFAAAPALENRLAQSGKQSLLQSIIDLRARIKIETVYQDEQLGLGHAVACARDWTAGEPFLCLLGDTLFSGAPLPATQLIQSARELDTSVIGLEEVAVEKVDRYGIVVGESVGEHLFALRDLIEKPSPAAAPSRLAIAARYVLSPGIFDCLARTPRGKGGEIQLTDAIRLLLGEESVHGLILKAKRHDIGNPIDWLRTNLYFARQDANVWRQISPLLRQISDEPI